MCYICFSKFLRNLDGKESACNAGDPVQSLDWEDPLEKEMVTYSSILVWKNPMDGGAWSATVHGVAKSWTGLSNFFFFLYLLDIVFSWFIYTVAYSSILLLFMTE